MRLQRALTMRATIARADEARSAATHQAQAAHVANAAHTAATDHLALSSKPCLPAPRRMKQADGCDPPHSLDCAWSKQPGVARDGILRGGGTYAY